MKNYNTECKLCELDIPHSHVTDEDFYPKLKPLSDDEILKVWNELFVGNTLQGLKFARAIEAAHGIGVKDARSEA